MHCAYDQFACPFMELGCLTCLIHTITHPRCHGRSWNGILHGRTRILTDNADNNFQERMV